MSKPLLILIILVSIYGTPCTTQAEENIIEPNNTASTNPFNLSIPETFILQTNLSTSSPLIDVFNAAQMTEAILSSSLVSSTSTEFFGPTFFDESNSNPIEQIESSTTTLSIEAPFIKQWQTLGGITRTLSLNTKNDQVLLLQGALKGLVPEFKPTYITSYFGIKTKEAVILLQKRYGIEQNGVVGPKTRALLNQKYLNNLCPQKASVVRLYENINRTNSVPLDYTPPELRKLQSPIKTTGVICLSDEPATALELLFNDAKKEGHQLIVLSGYRRPEIQKLLLAWSSKNNIKSTDEEALSLAEAGHSEHQLGTTVDLGGRSQNFNGPYSSFGETPEGKWLRLNSYKYGFSMSYPKGKEDVTGYIYEPWHFRYIGTTTAKEIYDNGISIQEYLSRQN
ncbi:MAG: D-alanyl-D-alanine carboxypeptidase family protein [Candidatus Pacebacteria bacterium]|nr:D-alanyl-D-alanine carboxypeptidase family protein [Candidatus Paceibacterota bacterium]